MSNRNKPWVYRDLEYSKEESPNGVFNVGTRQRLLSLGVPEQHVDDFLVTNLGRMALRLVLLTDQGHLAEDFKYWLDQAHKQGYENGHATATGKVKERVVRLVEDLIPGRPKIIVERQ